MMRGFLDAAEKVFYNEPFTCQQAMVCLLM